MDWIPTRLTYQQTGFFSRIITDYLGQAVELSSFYAHPATAEGLSASLAVRKRFPTDRKTLVSALEEQYAVCLEEDK